MAMKPDVTEAMKRDVTEWLGDPGERLGRILNAREYTIGHAMALIAGALPRDRRPDALRAVTKESGPLANVDVRKVLRWLPLACDLCAWALDGIMGHLWRQEQPTEPVNDREAADATADLYERLHGRTDGTFDGRILHAVHSPKPQPDEWRWLPTPLHEPLTYAVACARGQYYRGILGAIVGDEAGGVVHTDVWLVSRDDLPLQGDGDPVFVLAPWSRYWPDRATLAQEQDAIREAWKAVGFGLPDERVAVVAHSRPFAGKGREPPEMLPHTNLFTGPSLGLAVHLACQAACAERSLHAFATGEVGPDGMIGNVAEVRRKCEHLTRYLKNPDPVHRAMRCPTRLKVVVPAGQRDEAIQGLRGDVRATDERVVEFASLKEIIESRATVFDPFAFPNDAYAPPHSAIVDGLAEDDEQLFFGRLEAVAQVLIRGWGGQSEPDAVRGEDAGRHEAGEHHKYRPEDYDEVFLCTPFHAKYEDAKATLERAAGTLAWHILRLRSEEATRDPTTPIPAPIVVDLVTFDRNRQPDGLSRAWQATSVGKELYDGLEQPDVDLAMRQPGRLVFVVIDTRRGAGRTTLRLAECDEESRELIDRVCREIRNPEVGGGLAPQRFILLSPNLHAQLFVQEVVSPGALKIAFHAV